MEPSTHRPRVEGFLMSSRFMQACKALRPALPVLTHIECAARRFSVEALFGDA
jgi:hypothetical protein